MKSTPLPTAAKDRAPPPEGRPLSDGAHDDGGAAALGDDLADSERKLRGIIALAADAVISTDDEFRITLFNPAAEQIFGYSAAEVLGRPLDLLLPESARSAHRVHLEHFRVSAVQSKEMGHRGQIWGRRRSGELFPAEASVSKILVREAMHFTAVLRDVTQQRRAEQEREALLLREMQSREAAETATRRIAFLARATEVLHSSLAYEETFATLLQLIVPELATYCVIDVLEESGTVRRLNVVHADGAMQPVADRLRLYPRTQSHYLTRNAITGRAPELIEHVADDLLINAAESAEHLMILRALAPASAIIVPLNAREQTLGALFFARDASRPPYDASDLAFGVELAQRAATALDNARLYRHAQQAIRARDDVLGVVSHDLRNPLSVISMCATSLLESGVDDERTQEATRTIHESTRWALRLIQDLLDISSIEAGGLSLTRRSHDPVLLVVRAALLFEKLAEERAITLLTDVPEWMPAIDVDADRVLQALGNLIANALKFTPTGQKIRLGAALDAGFVRFFVADTGCGIPDDDVPNIFDRFWTARGKSRVRGTGMGLAIVKGIVEAHGGRVWVERNPAGGATFNLLLPLVASTASTSTTGAKG
jgi:PAS domain S-box-containing protein